MITTRRQQELTQVWVQKFEAALREEAADPTDPLAQASRAALQSQLDDLREELNDYENTSGKTPTEGELHADSDTTRR
jgi:hypothetical protein